MNKVFKGLFTTYPPLLPKGRFPLNPGDNDTIQDIYYACQEPSNAESFFLYSDNILGSSLKKEEEEDMHYVKTACEKV